MNNEETMPELVLDFHSPFLIGLKSSVDILQHFTSRFCPLLPCRMFIGEFSPFKIAVGLIVKNVEEVPWHAGSTICGVAGSKDLTASAL
jgi:hypothetical protein